MNLTLGTTPSWALRASMLVVLLCLPLLTGITYNWIKLKDLTSNHERDQRTLFEYIRVESEIKEKLRQQEKITTDTPDLLKKLFPIGRNLSKDIVLLTLDASLKKQDVQLDIAAKSLPDLFDFITRLQNIPLQVELQSHRVEKDKKQEWPIRATINVHLSVEVVSEI